VFLFEVFCGFFLAFNFCRFCGQVLNQVESTDYSQATSVVYTQEYPITLPMAGIGQICMLNASCLPMYMFVFGVFIIRCTFIYHSRVHTQLGGHECEQDDNAVCTGYN